MSRIGWILMVCTAAGAILAATLCSGCTDNEYPAAVTTKPVPPGGSVSSGLHPIWTRSLGGRGNDVMARATTDRAGDLILSGYALNRAESSAQPWPSMDPQPSRAPQPEGLVPRAERRLVYIARMAPDGALRWVAPFHGAFDDRYQHGLATDWDGNIYFAGSFSGRATFGSFTLTAERSAEIVLVKLTPTGQVLWASQIGGRGAETPTGVHNHVQQLRVGEDGTITIAGVFTGELVLDSRSLRARGPSDGFVARLDPGGRVIWAVRAGSNDPAAWEGIVGLAVDAKGRSVIAGVVAGAAEVGELRVDLVTPTIFVARLETSGQVAWISTPPPGCLWSCNDLMLDAVGSTYLSGAVALPGGSASPIVVKLDSRGGFLWETHASAPLPCGQIASVQDQAAAGDAWAVITRETGPSRPAPVAALGSSAVPCAAGARPGPLDLTVQTGQDGATALVRAADGGVFVTGQFTGVKHFGALTLTAAGGQDAFLAKIDPDGGFRWARRLGGAGRDWGLTLIPDSVRPDRLLWVAGHFQGTATIGGEALTAVDDYDVFVWRTWTDWLE